MQKMVYDDRRPAEFNGMDHCSMVIGAVIGMLTAMILGAFIMITWDGQINVPPDLKIAPQYDDVSLHSND